MVKEKTIKKVEVSRELGVNLYRVDKVREKDDSGNNITCPTLAFAHLLMPCGYGDIMLRGFRVLRGKDGNPFVARPGRTRQLFDKNGKKVSTQRFSDIRISGAADAEFDQDLKERILSAYGKED